MRRSPSRRVDHAAKPTALANFERQTGREPKSAVVVAWPLHAARPTLTDVGLGQLEEENAQLRKQVVDLALAVQALRSEICGGRFRIGGSKPRVCPVQSLIWL